MPYEYEYEYEYEYQHANHFLRSCRTILFKMFATTFYTVKMTKSLKSLYIHNDMDGNIPAHM